MELLFTDIELALPAWSQKDWCHPECYLRWALLEPEVQMLMGGHVHHNPETDTWSVPKPRPTLVAMGKMKL